MTCRSGGARYEYTAGVCRPDLQRNRSHGEISGFVTDISYTDPASGEADSLDITLQDRDRRWTGAWIPVAGDTLAATIRALNCQYSGDNRILPCGFFIVDSFSFSGWPVSGSISAISTPLDSSFTTTQRTKTWENVTIKEIGTEIAGRAGIALAWDAEGTPVHDQERGAIGTNRL